MSESSDNENNMSLSDDDIVDQSDNLNLAGCVLDKYNILTELGRGMYSIVWLAYCIENKKYYAIKVQHPNEYKEGVAENTFVKSLPNISVLNTIVHDFKEIKNNQKYLCTVYNLHCSNLDCILRKGKYDNGIPFHIAKKIFIEILEACNYLHSKLKVYHGDIKTDNILLKGINKKCNHIIKMYNDFYVNKKNNNREQLHSSVVNSINIDLENNDIDKYNIDHLTDFNVSSVTS
jgi:serine/threonine protein kinase